MTKTRTLLFYIAMFALVYGFVEAASFSLYYFARNKVFSFEENQAERNVVIASPSKPIYKAQQIGEIVGHNVAGQEYYEVLHPYLGFVLDPVRGDEVSDYGFPDLDVAPYVLNDSPFVIGIFGGSFAAATARLADDVLINKLQTNPLFREKDVFVLGVAMGGYKQPQQLLSLAYLLFLGVQFDVVINLDGFNEIALPPIDNIPKNVFPFYPRSWYQRAISSDPKGLALLSKHEELTKKRSEWAAVFSHTILRWSVTANVFWRAYDNVLFKKIQNNRQSAQSFRSSGDPGYTVTGPRFDFTNENELYAALVEAWASASAQMHKITAANGGIYLHFLQPNQYVKNSKPMRKEEREVAFRHGHVYQKGVELGYPLLSEAGKKLIRQGILFKDLTNIFANRPEALYVDDCCHLGRPGYGIVAVEIAKTIEIHWANKIARRE